MVADPHAHRGIYTCLDCESQQTPGQVLWFPLPHHAKNHHSKYPDHLITYACITHDTTHSYYYMTGRKIVGRGGRRPGAGAPKGNMNALKHGQRVKDREVKSLLADVGETTARQRIVRYLKKKNMRGE